MIRSKPFKVGQVVWYMGSGEPVETKLVEIEITTSITEEGREVTVSYITWDGEFGNRFNKDDILCHTEKELLEAWERVREVRGY